MRSMILRVLLLAVWFNTAIGMPLHAAEHLPGHVGGPAVVTLQRLALAEATHGWGPGHLPLAHGPAAEHHHQAHDHAGHGHAACEGDDHAAAHAACVWCLSHAQLAMALAAPLVGLLPALAGPAFHCPAAAVAFVPQPERWRYASRDPPLAQRG